MITGGGGEKYYIYCNFLDYSTLMFYKYHPSKKNQNFIHLPLSHRLLFGCLLNIIVVVKHKKQGNLGWLWLLHIGTVHILCNTTLSIIWWLTLRFAFLNFLCGPSAIYYISQHCIHNTFVTVLIQQHQTTQHSAILCFQELTTSPCMQAPRFSDGTLWIGIWYNGDSKPKS